MIEGLNYFLVDIETTGLSTSLHDIIEISLIRMHDKMQLNRKIRAKNPKTASMDALKITGKVPADLYKGIELEQAIDDVNNFLNSDGLLPSDRCMVGHNVLSFDKRWLHAKWTKYEREFPAQYWVDTLAMSRELVKLKGISGKPSLKLHAACDLFGVKKTSEAHNSKDDTKSNYYLWMKLKEENIDHLKYIKSFPHSISQNLNEDEMKELMDEF